ncbi:MAG: methyltransferase domain-containing protein [Ilumatobacteraceae bacterium]
MASGDTHGLGYDQVDDDPNVAVLVATMEATAQWEATVRLRSWERSELQLRPGQRLLDVGCGLGEAALALATDLGTGGEVVGVDASAEMLRVARAKAAAAPCRAEFVVGDAAALALPDGSFDAVRSERTLQWLPDPAAAIAEMARVVRPGGRVSLIDTDWSTFTLDIGDDVLMAMIHDAFRHERRRPSNIGGRLHALVEHVGLTVVARTHATQVRTSWNPDETPAPDGCFSMRSLADDLVESGRLDAGERDRVVQQIEQAAREGRFRMTLTMHAAVATSR